MADIEIYLPYNLDTFTMRAVVSDVVKQWGEIGPDRLIIDFSRMGFIEPSGVTFLSNFIHWLHYRNIRCDFRNHDRNTPCIAFLDDSLFFEQHLGKKLNQYRQPRRTTQHLRRVGTEESHSFIRMILAPWLISSMSINAASLYPIQTCISEIFLNIADHTGRENGSIFAQHFPNKKKIKIAIADFGVGVHHNIKKVFPDISANDAILKAVEADFSTKSTPRNRGVGLDYLLQTVVGGNGGEVTISSTEGMVKFQPSDGGILPIPSTVSGYCPGTTIDVVLRTDTIEYVEDEREDLEW